MRITVSDIDTPGGDGTRAYAEYRFFSQVARHADVVDAVQVSLKRNPAADPPFSCMVTLELGSGDRIKTQARGGHPTAAIDRAADRAAWLLHHRTERPHFSVKASSFSS